VCHSCTLPNATHDPETFPCEVLRGAARFVTGQRFKG
jgi:hypothetical protein